MRALSIIEAEHRNMYRVARAMAAIGDRLQANSDSIEIQKIGFIIDYFDNFTERYHHPKEDEYFFSRLHARSEKSHPVLDRLKQEHEMASRQLVELRRMTTVDALADETRRNQLRDLLRDYMTFIAEHMRFEEQHVFALARAAFTAEDWNEIDAAFASHTDPLDSAEGEGEVALLRQRIMQLLPAVEEVPVATAPVAPTPAEPILEVAGLKTRYGRIEALHGVSITVKHGQLVALVGANGAGKTTLLRCISGVQPLSEGRITYVDRDISGLRSHKRVREGICQVPEGRQVFGPMAIEDNLRMGALTRPSAEIKHSLEEVYAMFPILKERRDHPAGTLSGGQQQMLALGRALMGKPRLLLLDEPSMGLAPVIVEEIFRTIRTLKENGITILLVEQNARAALSIADYAYVMETGNVTLEGPGKELLANDDVRRAYLGM